MTRSWEATPLPGEEGRRRELRQGKAAVTAQALLPRISACRVYPRRGAGGGGSPGGSGPGTLCPPARGAAWSCSCPAPTTGMESGRDTGIIHRETPPQPAQSLLTPVPGWVILRNQTQKKMWTLCHPFSLRQLSGKAASCRRGPCWTCPVLAQRCPHTLASLNPECERGRSCQQLSTCPWCSMQGASRRNMPTSRA